jgi:hypothetical protein
MHKTEQNHLNRRRQQNRTLEIRFRGGEDELNNSKGSMNNNTKSDCGDDIGIPAWTSKSKIGELVSWIHCTIRMTPVHIEIGCSMRYSLHEEHRHLNWGIRR